MAAVSYPHEHHQHLNMRITVCWYSCDQIRVGLEQNDFTHAQRRITYMKYLGELYNARLIDPQVHMCSPCQHRVGF